MWECPVYDFSCPYFEDGGCNLRTAKADCDAWYDIVDEEDEQSSFSMSSRGPAAELSEYSEFNFRS